MLPGIRRCELSACFNTVAGQNKGRTLCRELLANGALLVEGTSDSLCGSSDGSVLETLECQSGRARQGVAMLALTALNCEPTAPSSLKAAAPDAAAFWKEGSELRIDRHATSGEAGLTLIASMLLV